MGQFIASLKLTIKGDQYFERKSQFLCVMVIEDGPKKRQELTLNKTYPSHCLRRCYPFKDDTWPNRDWRRLPNEVHYNIVKHGNVRRRTPYLMSTND